MIGQLVLGMWAATRRTKTAQTHTAPLGSEPTRPKGPVVWLNTAHETDLAAAKLLARSMSDKRPDLAIVVNCDSASLPPSDLPNVICAPSNGGALAFLARWRPDLIVHIGAKLQADLVPHIETPQMLVGARVEPPHGMSARLWRKAERLMLAKMREIHVEDQASAGEIARMKLPPAIVSGVITETPNPLEASEAERNAFSQTLRARPVWAALAVPQGEERAVLAAHGKALRHAHRTLLILQPEDPARAHELAETLEEAGWSIATRWSEGEPDDDTEIFIADDPSEAGLWYRIAPLTFLGGTLFGKGKAPRSPFEAAALGSAILHGPNTACFATDFERLEAARATHRVASASGLGDALADLLAPDRMAMLAHNAWVVTSGGAGVTMAITHAILAQLETLEIPA
ncbi:3-deoxy-D-manno-octulosonic acid transferase [Albirhodobacter sp. R86504]|uniref:3-deoxy-D-manno-octulosonic acid transferase n=1 Tax=Albirhodobacter sp. R86504 TaxID=3093848 RepID=UPI00366B56E5